MGVGQLHYNTGFVGGADSSLIASERESQDAGRFSPSLRFVLLNQCT